MRFNQKKKTNKKSEETHDPPRIADGAVRSHNANIQKETNRQYIPVVCGSAAAKLVQDHKRVPGGTPQNGVGLHELHHERARVREDVVLGAC